MNHSPFISTELKPIPMKQLPQYMQRVKDEQVTLDEKIRALHQFTLPGNLVFKGLDAEEQHRLKRQLKLMVQYSDILQQRLLAAMYD